MDVEDVVIAVAGVDFPPGMEVEESDPNLGNEGEQLDMMMDQELSFKVFGNEMLREIILEKAIFRRRSILSGPDARTIRLVNKNWLSTVSNCVRKAGKALFGLTLTRENSLMNAAFCEENGKLLSQFVRSMTDDSRLEDDIPNFSLRLTPAFFRKENHKDLSDCLTKCGNAMIALTLSFPLNSSMTFLFHSFSLPKLKNLSVQFSDERLPNNTSGLQTNAHTVYPLQSILNSTMELQELRFLYTRCAAYIPLGFEYIQLPSTITTLLFECPIKDCDLELLTKTELPTLRHLRLFSSGTESPLRDGLIFEVLNTFRTHLQIFNLWGNRSPRSLRFVTLFSFPVMESLRTLTVSSSCWDLDDAANPRLEEKLPKLKELRILNHTSSMFEKWTSQSRFETVWRLFVSLIRIGPQPPNPNQPGALGEQLLPITAEKMQCIQLAFPNLTCLDITLSGPETTGLKYLFMEMRTLQELAITLKGCSNAYNPSYWDSLLVGAPQDMTMSLRRNPDFWHNVDLKNTSFPSIRQLTELKSLAIVEYQPCSCGNPHNGPLVSDVTFHFAFLRMAKLKKLVLTEKFMPSLPMVEQWRREKGTIREIPGNQTS